MIRKKNFRNAFRTFCVAALTAAMLILPGCSGNVGIGMSVGVPVGDHGYISMGTGRYWY